MPMKYSYTAKGTSFTPAMKVFIEEHFKKFEKALKESIKFTLTVEQKTTELSVQVVTEDNKRLRASATGEDFYDIVTEVRDNISRQIVKSKEKFKDRRPATTPEEVEAFRSMYHVVRYKTLEAEPMTEWLAIQNMEALGHDFYIFKNDDQNGSMCVVYKRFEDDYGVITLI